MTKTEEHTVQLTINGEIVQAEVPSDLNLLHFLREQLHLTGTKNGCDTGHCGSCTVIVDGKARRACLLRVSKLDGAEVETIEGLGTDQALHALQQTFIEYGAVQCGYCTPGMLMAAKALLDNEPEPTRDDIRRTLDLNRNLCRCTGYVKVFEAIEAAAALLSGDGNKAKQPSADEGHVLLLPDAVGRVTGSTRFADDIFLDDMLHGAVLWSAHPHAEIISIDTSTASKMPGVQLIVTAKDIPGENAKGIVTRDEPAIADTKVRFIGDSLGAVFANTRSQALAAVEAIQVEYLPLKGVFSIEDAAAPDAPPIHPKGNLFHEATIVRGDVEAAFAECAVVVEDSYSTPFIEHAFLEPESGLGVPDSDGGVSIHYPTQTAFDDQKQLAAILDLPPEKVRVIQLPTGGAFGGKEDIIFHQYLALGALISQKPVKITLSREESLRAHVKRHPAFMHYKTGADSNGLILAIEAHVALDTGAYASLGLDVLENTVVFGAGPYFVPNLRLKGEAWYTNNVPAGAMRGFGVNQIAVALEQQMDRMARALNIDPIQFRLLNALDVGLPTAADHVLEDGIPGLKETLLAVRDSLESLERPPANGLKIGVGVASAVKNIGFGHGIPESAGVILELQSDGHVELKASQHEYGQGALAALAMMVSQELGTPLDQIHVHTPNTATTPETGPTTASRQTFLTGNATLMACQAMKDEVLGRAAEILDTDPADLRLDGNQVTATATGRTLDLRELGERFVIERRYHAPDSTPILEGEHSQYGLPGFTSRPTHWCYAYNTQAALVGVDPRSGKVEVLTILSANDVGRVINRQAVEGQIHGGVMMGVGYALSENFVVEEGINLTDSLHKCRVPKASDTPDIRPILVEVPHPIGPRGVKGFAEAPSLATAPAILNAIYDAVGIRINQIPVDSKLLRQEISDHTGTQESSGPKRG